MAGGGVRCRPPAAIIAAQSSGDKATTFLLRGQLHGFPIRSLAPTTKASALILFRNKRSSTAPLPGSAPYRSRPNPRDGTAAKRFSKLYPRIDLPTQIIERVSLGHTEPHEPNRLIWGDNLHVMRQIRIQHR